MAEGLQKRILPPRERRESANKRRDLTPPVKASPSSTPRRKPGSVKATPELRNSRGKEYVRGPYNTKRKAAVVIRDASTPGVEEVLRTKVIASGPIPTTRTQQAENLSSREYQSVAESAVLAAALHRSRMRWLCDGIFDKFWTKPVKKKGAPDIPPNNPDQKSMVKMPGTVTVTIEPHVFDAVFYTVRETPQIPTPQSKHANSSDKHAPPAAGYYASPGWEPSTHQSGLPQQQNGPDQTNTPSSRLPSASDKTVDQGPGDVPETPATDIQDVKMRGGMSRKPYPIDTRDIRLRGGAPATSAPSPASNTEPPKASTDPVIQMLALRAATDQHLKELMKQVATSKASPAQLKEFQAHIDEFNAVIKRQEAESKQAGSGQPPSKSSTPASKPATPAASHPAMYSRPVQLAGRATPNYSTPPHAGYPPHNTSHTLRLTPRPESAITAIVFELVTAPSYNQPAPQDRWLFPPYAVLDTPHSGRGLEMIVSWFVERTGAQIKKSLGITAEDEAGSLKWKDETTYFQPVTMKLNSTVHKSLMTIAVNAKCLPDVQKYMESVMESKTRAKEELLAMRLPRPGVEVTSETDGDRLRDSGVGVDVKAEEELKDFYGMS